jgi:hypothetical protein
MDVARFDDLKGEFDDITRRVVWATVTTVDRNNRPRSRILHPIWEGNTGWVATTRHSHKAKHLARNPFVSVTYWDQAHQQVMAECRAEWCDDAPTRQRIWKLFETTPEPIGFNPALFWPSVTDASFGVLRLTPWRIEVSALADMAKGKPARVWRTNDKSL